MASQENKRLIEEYWESFVQSLPSAGVDRPREFQAWGFGNSPEMADELGKLVTEGTKTATASLAWSYEVGPEPYPLVGGHCVILDGEGRPMCIIQTTDLSVVPFNKVDAEHAYQEGEGDRSLSYWREVHWRFFSAECEGLGREPDEEMPVVCEKFRLAFR
jgi:uncharacterized protein YhfF